MAKVNKTIGLTWIFQRVLPRSSLVTIYKAFIWPHLDYCDIIFDLAYIDSFHQKKVSVQYDVALAITGTTGGISKEKLYQEQGFESMKSGGWFRKLSLFTKIIKSETPFYLYNLIPKPFTTSSIQSMRNSKNVYLIKVNHNFSKSKYFLSPIIELKN